MEDENVLLIRTKKGVNKYNVNSIQSCEASGRYTIMTIRKKKTKISETLKSIEKKINHRAFVRIHRSTLVNIDFISEYNSQKNEIIFTNGKRFSISVRKKSLFLKKINAYYK